MIATIAAEIAVISVVSLRLIFENWSMDPGLKSDLGRLALTYLVTSLAAGVIIMSLLDTLVLFRLSRLASEVSSIGSSSNFSLRVPVTGKDEISSLADSVNNMVASLETSYNTLRQYSGNLELLVQERTASLRKSERLATIGVTAAMVGHDLRNPLQVVTNIIYLMSKRLGASEQLRETAEAQELAEDLQKLDAQVQYMNNVVSDLQDYARELKPKPVETSVRELIDDSLSTITIPEDVEPNIIVENSATVVVDPAMIRRVLVNLVSNAIQAMPRGGKLTLRASRSDGNTLIHVRDTGNGMTPEVMGKLFQPLFTTKAKGTGFGLPVCKRIVEAHGGEIVVESETGKGTIFTITIPDLKAHSQKQSDHNDPMMVSVPTR